MVIWSTAPCLIPDSGRDSFLRLSINTSLVHCKTGWDTDDVDLISSSISYLPLSMKPRYSVRCHDPSKVWQSEGSISETPLLHNQLSHLVSPIQMYFVFACDFLCHMPWRLSLLHRSAMYIPAQ